MQSAVNLMLGLPHLQNGRPLKRPDDRLVAAGTEGLVVGEDRFDRVKGIGREDLLALFGILEDSHLRPAVMHRRRCPQLVEHRIRQGVAVGAHPGVELGLRILDALRQFIGHAVIPHRSDRRGES